MTKCYFRVLFENCSFDPGPDTTLPDYEYSTQQTSELCKNGYFRVFMENILLTSEMCSFDLAQTNKQTNPFNFFHMTLPSVERIFEQVILIGQFGHTPFL